jgi:hypothetical protein
LRLWRKKKKVKKLASKGVVRLFNAIRAAQKVGEGDNVSDDEKSKKRKRRSVKEESASVLGDVEERADTPSNKKDGLEIIEVGSTTKGFNVLGEKGKHEARKFLRLLSS